MHDDRGQEQRTFWAILLVMGLMVVWMQLFPTNPPAPRPGADDAGETVGRETPGLREAGPDSSARMTPGETGVEGRAPAGGPASLLGVLEGSNAILRRDDDAPESAASVEVRQDDLWVVIDGQGARVTQVTLPAFTEGESVPVQLLPEAGAGALGSVLIVGDREISLDHFVFRLVSDATAREGRRVVWELPLEGLTLRKTFVVPSEGSVLRVEHELVGDRLGLTAWGLSWAGGLRVTEERRGSTRGPYFQGAVLAEGKVQKKDAQRLRRDPAEFAGRTRFVGVQNKYFLAAIVPHGEQQGPSKLWQVAAGSEAEASVGGEILVERTPGIAANAVSYDVYVGPLDYAKLSSLGYGLEGVVDLGWSWVRPLSRLILSILIWMHSLIPNYGVVIIIFSVCVNFLFFPLTYKSTKSMRDMAALKPRLDALKQKYKDDPQKMSEATMRLYKEAGVNPLGGCLPLLLQMPIFFALYAVLFHTIELRQAPFMLWIQDLSQPDVIIHLPFSLPWIGTGVALLPIIMGVTSFFQSKATMVDPSQKTMLYLMPIMMTFIFLTMPSGLVLYWLVSNIFTIVQKALMKPSAAAEATAGA